MKKYYLIICLLISITLISCTDSASLESNKENSIYYWRTTFSLSDNERDFLKAHDVKKIYVRFFDVDWAYPAKNGEDVTLRNRNMQKRYTNELVLSVRRITSSSKRYSSIAIGQKARANRSFDFVRQ